MSYGLLSGAFRPKDEICALRAVSRQRDMLSTRRGMSSTCRRPLAQMNVQLANVISDIVGETGQKIVRAPLSRANGTGPPRPDEECAHPGERAEIAKSLRGNWREEHLFALRQAMALYDAYGERLAECDQQLEALLAALRPKRPVIRAESTPLAGPECPKFDVGPICSGCVASI